jgi:hypothetical protein
MMKLRQSRWRGQRLFPRAQSVLWSVGERIEVCELAFETHGHAALAAPKRTYAYHYDFGGPADSWETTGKGDGGRRASPSRPAPAGPTISRAPRA